MGLGWAFDFLLSSTAVTMPAHDHGASAWATASAVVLVAALAAFAAGDVRAWWRGRRPASGAVHRIEIEGMTCGGCARRVSDALRGVDGVTGAEVDHAAGLATVHGDASEGVLHEAVRQAGYRPVGP
jgi:copper chaperone CopZ